MSDFVTALLDRPAVKVQAAVPPPKPPVDAPRGPRFVRSVPTAVSKSTKNNASDSGLAPPWPKNQPIVANGGIPKSRFVTEEEKRRKKEAIAKLRTANRGGVPLASVSKFAKQLEHSISTPSSVSASASSGSSGAAGTRAPQPRSRESDSGRPSQAAARPPARGPGGAVLAAIPAMRGDRPVKQGPRPPPSRKRAAPANDKPKIVVIAGVPQPPKLSRGGLGAAQQAKLFGERGVAGHLEEEARSAKAAVRRGGLGDRIEEEEEDDLGDFIDDGPLDGGDWRAQLRNVTGYDPQAYQEADADEALESSFSRVEGEEKGSARIARKEDADELIRIKEEEAREREKRKKRKLS